MDKKNKCRLCLVSKNKIIKFFSDEGIKLNIAQILVQHFWFQVFIIIYYANCSIKFMYLLVDADSV